MVKNPPADAGDTGSIPGSGRSPGGGNGTQHQSACLGNLMDRGAMWLQSTGSQSRTRLHLSTCSLLTNSALFVVFYVCLE